MHGDGRRNMCGSELIVQHLCAPLCAVVSHQDRWEQALRSRRLYVPGAANGKALWFPRSSSRRPAGVWGNMRWDPRMDRAWLRAGQLSGHQCNLPGGWLAGARPFLAAGRAGLMQPYVVPRWSPRGLTIMAAFRDCLVCCQKDAPRLGLAGCSSTPPRCPCCPLPATPFFLGSVYCKV